MQGRVLHRPARFTRLERSAQKQGYKILIVDDEDHIRRILRFQLEKHQYRVIDAENGASRNLSIDPAYRLVHSGDVKIYQNVTVLPRAFIVHQARAVASEEQALDLMRDPSFDPSREVLLTQAQVGATAPATRASSARIMSYTPEQVRIEARLDSPGYLVLTETYYPGWQAEVDGAPVSIELLQYRADGSPILERAIDPRWLTIELAQGQLLDLGGEVHTIVIPCAEMHVAVAWAGGSAELPLQELSHRLGVRAVPGRAHAPAPGRGLGEGGGHPAAHGGPARRHRAGAEPVPPRHGLGTCEARRAPARPGRTIPLASSPTSSTNQAKVRPGPRRASRS